MEKTSYALRGLDDDAPVSGSDEYNYWLDILNRKKDELYYDVTKNWSTSYDVRSLGFITVSSAPTYDVDDGFLAPSDTAYVIKTDGTRTDYEFIKPNERSTRVRSVFLANQNPVNLYFSNPIVTGEDIIGGTLYLPGYYLPADLTVDADELPFPDPNWAVAAVASEIAFADITYEDRAEALNAKANMLYSLMVKRNRRGTFKNPRTTPTVVRPIRDTRTN